MPDSNSNPQGTVREGSVRLGLRGPQRRSCSPPLSPLQPHRRHASRSRRHNVRALTNSICNALLFPGWALFSRWESSLSSASQIFPAPLLRAYRARMRPLGRVSWRALRACVPAGLQLLSHRRPSVTAPRVGSAKISHRGWK